MNHGDEGGDQEVAIQNRSSGFAAARREGFCAGFSCWPKKKPGTAIR
jgi:hypothetical protein